MQTYKLFVRVSGEKYDGNLKYDDNLNVWHPNTASLFKSVTLYSIMLESITGRDNCLVLDSFTWGM